MMKLFANNEKRFSIDRRKNKRGFLVVDNQTGNKLLPTNFSQDVPYLIKEIELLCGVKKHFDSAPRKSFLDDQFFQNQAKFHIQAIGIYDNDTATNIQCVDI